MTVKRFWRGLGSSRATCTAPSGSADGVAVVGLVELDGDAAEAGAL